MSRRILIIVFTTLAAGLAASWSTAAIPVVVTDRVEAITDNGSFQLTTGWVVKPDWESDPTTKAISVGDLVRVVGSCDPSLSAGHLTAAAISVLPRLSAAKDGGDSGDGSGDEEDDSLEVEVHGVLDELLPPDRFRLDDGQNYTVVDSTFYDDGLSGYVDLAPGQILEIKARRLPGGVFEVDRISVEGDDDDGGRVEIEGPVIEVDDTGLTLNGGTRVVRTPSTLVAGDADTWSDIQPGWWAEVDGLVLAEGSIQAEEIHLDDQKSGTTAGEDFEPQQALVVLSPGADGSALAQRHGAVVAGVVGDLAVLLWWADDIDDELLATLDADQAVAAVEPNYLFRDPESVRRRYPIVDFAGSADKVANQPAALQIRASEAHAMTRGSGTVVAVVDTGVDPNHPLLEGRILDGGLDLVDGDNQPWERRLGLDEDGDGDIDEAAGHGTFVASIVATFAPETKILPYRVLDDDGGGTAYGVALAIADATERGVDVINLSLVYQSRSSAVDLLLEAAAARGIIVIASAGNDGSTIVPFPASDSHVLAVTALDTSGSALADFANSGSLVKLAAPGEDIYGALDLERFASSSGTSMAAPFVAATVALLRAQHPGLNPSLTAAVLEQSGTLLAGTGSAVSALDMAAAVALVGQAPAPVAHPSELSSID